MEEYNDGFSAFFRDYYYYPALTSIDADGNLTGDEVLQYAMLVTHNSFMPPKYKHWKEHYDEMAVHVNGTYPEKLISERRPKEDAEIWEYRRRNYEPITKGIMREAINSLNRIFNEQNYEFRNLSEDLESYIKGPRFQNLNFINWIQYHVLYDMILDPNALLVVLPYGRGLNDSSVKVDIKVETVPSCRVRLLEDNIVMYLSEEKSLVQWYNKQSLEGDVYYILTKTDLYKYYQIGKKTGNDYEIKLIYRHNLGFIPYTFLGGEWNSTLGIYESFFNSFVPFANESIKQYSDFQAVMVTSAYPTRVVKHIECNYEDHSGRCIGGYMNNDDHHVCPKCKGSGQVPASSPYGVYVRLQNILNNESDSDIPPLEYISPDPAILDFVTKIWQQLLDHAKECLHLNTINEAQSGDAKTIDREREYAMIMKISNNIFDNIIAKTLYTIELYRNINSLVREPQIIKPKEFNLKTEKDLTQDLATLKASNAPIPVIRDVLKELIKRRSVTDISRYYTQMFLMEYCNLYVYTLAEQLELYKNKLCSLMDVLRFTYGPSILESYLRDGKIEIKPSNFTYLSGEIDKEIIEQLDAISNNSVNTWIKGASSNGLDISAYMSVPILGAEGNFDRERDFEFSGKDLRKNGINNDYLRGLAKE